MSEHNIITDRTEFEKSISDDNQTITKLYEAVGELKAENQKLRKDVDDFTKAYSRAIQFIYYMSKRLGLPLSERLLASKDLILNLKEKVDNFIKEETVEETKYPFEFAKWMKEKNIHLHSNGKFYADGWVRVSDEQVGELWNEFVGVEGKLEPALLALKNLQVHYLEVNEQVLQLQAELFKANEVSEEHEKQRDFWHFEAQREHKEVEELKAKLKSITADQEEKI